MEVINMERYISLKIVDAKKMTQSEYYECQGEQFPLNMVDQDGYLVRYKDGYTSWCPKQPFEESHRLLEDLIPVFDADNEHPIPQEMGNEKE